MMPSGLANTQALSPIMQKSRVSIRLPYFFISKSFTDLIFLLFFLSIHCF